MNTSQITPGQQKLIEALIEALPLSSTRKALVMQLIMSHDPEPVPGSDRRGRRVNPENIIPADQLPHL
jgi:hypothetical protein